jgi:two-component system copper resistance phosphate regulon response regulator CusR
LHSIYPVFPFTKSKFSPFQELFVRILVSAADSGFAAFLEQTFLAERYVVDRATDWQETRSLAESREYDLALLDMSLSDPAGLAALQHLRGILPHLPILVLINRTQLEDSVRLLTLGADDFVFRSAASSPELFVRARAVLHRGGRPLTTILQVQDLELNPAKRTVTRAGRAIRLTSKEYSLLEYLMRNAGRGVTREQIIEHAWNLPAAPHTNVVEVYINYLRKKVDGESEHKLIHTIRGTGYRLMKAGPERSPARAASA